MFFELALKEIGELVAEGGENLSSIRLPHYYLKTFR